MHVRFARSFQTRLDAVYKRVEIGRATPRKADDRSLIAEFKRFQRRRGLYGLRGDRGVLSRADVSLRVLDKIDGFDSMVWLTTPTRRLREAN